jgi:hypothetical protein
MTKEYPMTNPECRPMKIIYHSGLVIPPGVIPPGGGACQPAHNLLTNCRA